MVKNTIPAAPEAKSTVKPFQTLQGVFQTSMATPEMNGPICLDHLSTAPGKPSNYVIFIHLI